MSLLTLKLALLKERFSLVLTLMFSFYFFEIIVLKVSGNYLTPTIITIVFQYVIFNVLKSCENQQGIGDIIRITFSRLRIYFSDLFLAEFIALLLSIPPLLRFQQVEVLLVPMSLAPVIALICNKVDSLAESFILLPTILPVMYPFIVNSNMMTAVTTFMITLTLSLAVLYSFPE